MGIQLPESVRPSIFGSKPRNTRNSVQQTISKEENIKQSVGDASDQFTVTDIACGLGMFREEKTMSRVIQELRRVHANKIIQTNVRNGKVFQYYYSIKQTKQQQ